MRENRIIDSIALLLLTIPVVLILRWVGWMSWEAVSVAILWAVTSRWYGYGAGYREALKASAEH